MKEPLKQLSINTFGDIVLAPGIPTINHHVYSKDVIAKAVRKFQKVVKDDKAMVILNPDPGLNDSSLAKIAGYISEVKLSKKGIKILLKLEDTSAGKEILEGIKQGKRLFAITVGKGIARIDRTTSFGIIEDYELQRIDVQMID